LTGSDRFTSGSQAGGDSKTIAVVDGVRDHLSDVLIFLGSMRGTVAVLFSVPLSALATLIAMQVGGSSINTMVLAGLALAVSQLIDKSINVVENVYRHLERGDPPNLAAEKRARKATRLALSATLTTGVVLFPVTSPRQNVAFCPFRLPGTAGGLSNLPPVVVVMSQLPAGTSKRQ
jgi:hypothetical protein